MTAAIQNKTSGPDWLVGGGEMGERIRSFDWANTPLGPAEVWPQSLRSAVSILLPSKAQIVLFWGHELITLYNDAYRPVFGAKHPRALGLPVHESWSELWITGLRELFEGVLRTGETFWAEDHPFYMERHGYLEETYFNISYDPVRDETGNVGGIFCIVAETTNRFLGDRRLRTLRDLGARASEARLAEHACEIAAQILENNTADVPFALIYLLDAEGQAAHLTAVSNLDRRSAAAPQQINLSESPGEQAWPFAVVAETREPELVTDSIRRFGALPGGPWPESSASALVLPLGALSQKKVTGFLVAGVNPRRALDEQYRDFFNLVAGHVTTAVANARAHEEERKRAEALAELDRAKTTFFSNVSHEFRTPLTLILGPMEDTLADAGTPTAVRERLEVSHRNSLRLQKLVNSLLDFSRIEAGRIQASYEPTALGALTVDLASVFRSAIERAGMRLTIYCERLREPVYVDREMWEKIVLNLVSNAFKYTFEGEIVVSLRQSEDAVELSVRDSGIGISASELPHLFERFYRVEGARGRTHEGTGIGLALVQELVKLHGGTINVASVYGKGTTFTVRLPMGSTHLPPEKIKAGGALVSTAVASAVYREEALHWLRGESPHNGAQWISAGADTTPLDAPPVASQGARILLADDNADMRDYVRNLLARYYRVETVADGEAALAAACREKPDLLLTDVMMPQMDGFALLRAIREKETLKTVPVIMLSARAGEESRIEGLEAGVDDYLIKPFSARELLARVGAQLQLARLRRETEQTLRESEERFRLVADAANDVIWEIDVNRDRVWWSEAMQRVFGYAPEDIGLHTSWYYERIHPEDRDRVVNGMAGVIEGKAQVWSDEFRFHRTDGTYAYVIDSAFVARDATEKAVRIVGSMRDISERKRAEEKLRQSEDRLAGILRQASVGIAQVDMSGRFVMVNDRYCEITGRSREELLGLCMQDITHPDDVERNLVLFQSTAETGEDFEIEKRYVRPDGSFVWAHNSVYAVRNVTGRIEYLVAVSLDITERKQAEETLKQAQGRLEDLNTFLETRVAERTADLLRSIAERERLQDQLLQAQKMESVGTLASGVAHDFNNLLNIILSYTTIMRLDDKNPARVSEGTSVIEETVRRGATLVQQLMSLGRKSETKFAPVRLNSVAEKLANLLTETFSKTIVITLDLERELPMINGDDNQLHQTLLNLCVNARDAMPGGGRISLKTETVSGTELRRRFPEAEAERFASISVSDRGSGMDEATRRRVFEPFFTTKPLGQGTGLGLAVVYGIVKNHAGFIEVESQMGRGSTFCIYLPVPNEATAQTSQQRVSSAALKPAGRGETILFVDDEEHQLNVMRRFLESEGYRVLAAKDGLEALETFRRHKEEVAVAVLDLGLPKLGGWQAFQQMREIRPELKALVATGFVSADVEAEMAQGKLGGVIAKPYQLDDVLEKISQAIHGR